VLRQESRTDGENKGLCRSSRGPRWGLAEQGRGAREGDEDGLLVLFQRTGPDPEQLRDITEPEAQQSDG